MSKVKQVFKTSDGKTFASAAEADRHEVLLDAERLFKQAGDRLMTALGETGLTADGQHFDLSRIRDYWFIAPRHDGGLPHLVRIAIWPREVEFTTDYGDEPSLRVRIRSHDRDPKDRTLLVSHLYADEQAAHKAHLAACEERLTQIQEQLAEWRKKPPVHAWL